MAPGRPVRSRAARRIDGLGRGPRLAVALQSPGAIAEAAGALWRQTELLGKTLFAMRLTRGSPIRPTGRRCSRSGRCAKRSTSMSRTLSVVTPPAVTPNAARTVTDGAGRTRSGRAGPAAGCSSTAATRPRSSCSRTARSPRWEAHSASARSAGRGSLGRTAPDRGVRTRTPEARLLRAPRSWPSHHREPGRPDDLIREAHRTDVARRRSIVASDSRASRTGRTSSAGRARGGRPSGGGVPPGSPRARQTGP
jgi:hypothetical protein